MSALDAENIRHAFFTREGGVSGGIFASLNCGFGSSDDKAKIAENRERAAASLGLPGDRLVTCFQVHSAEAVVVERPWRRDEHPRADAMVTRTPGVALGILTADCAPVLFADAQAGVIGAAHAGWRGALNGILDETVRKMQELGAVRDRIKAAIGPCIAQPSYEVGPEFPSPFLAEAAENTSFFTPAARPGHFLFDLAGYAARRLNRLGIVQVDRTGGDTAAEAERFFSYRRACLQGERDYGRELSAICLAA